MGKSTVEPRVIATTRGEKASLSWRMRARVIGSVDPFGASRMKTMTLETSDPIRGAGFSTRRAPYAADGGAVATGTVMATRPSMRPVARGASDAQRLAEARIAATAQTPGGTARLPGDEGGGLFTREVV